ncbi:DUF6482 family protein [Bacterioplanoides sp. SCSIO 12839]|uniref:DUF6482 family protein n=1 Tax=Bacterioplanoides sp. SCSIO 12839 TaxID=2829569 RepID=UPI002102EE72|nr:DUF6482 family protein [Bacterioplanoides sp. SCSIO 12839]UTW49028.1 hypothetical protein KFF03_03735 [Bacterioplanoides sp. SCSIO 12839]
MTIRIRDLKKVKTIEKVIIHSLDLCLYQASVMIDGEEHYVTDDKGKLLRSYNVLSFQAMFEKFPAQSFVIKHQSAYDEMVGQPVRECSNAIEVAYGNNQLAAESSTLPVVH